MANKRIKVAGYAQRIFFNDNIEYRDFSPDLVGFQLTSDGGTTLFTNGNFSISVNLDPKPDVLFKQGTKSKFYTLDDITTSETTQLDIQKNVRTKLNIDLTNPLSYIWYGSAKELVRASLIEIQEKWPAAIYVDNKVGSVTGNNITNYVYDIEADESTFSVNSNFFSNPYVIKYTVDAQYTGNDDNSNPLRNFTLNYGSYVIEHNGISKKIKSITPATQKTNSEIELVVEGNPFPELTGIFIPQLSFLFNNVDASIPYFIKPNEDEIEKFFTGLNDLQKNILNRDVFPKYRSEIISTNYTDDGILLTTKSVLDFPVLSDGYNLNFFDSFYIAYLDSINNLGVGLDETKTDIIVRKYTTEAISSFDTIPRADNDDLILNGEKATKLLRIYGVEFDYIKKYINGIKFAHVVTYNKQNNVPDSLVKDLAYMLGLEPINFINDTSFSKLFLPSNGAGQFSGTSVNLTQSDIDIELYRRLILNIAWLWKSKGSRKAVEFLFRFIGAPESLVNFNEYIVIVDKPLDIEEIKKLLYLYTGEVNLDNIPYDENGFPLPPTNGDLVITDFINPETGELVENSFTEMYFQKAGGWYRETYGSNVVSVLNGNNPHVGRYDGGNEYLKYFSRCYIPNFNSEPSVTITANTLVQNYFINYNYGIFNGVDDNTEIYTTQLTFNPLTNGYQPIGECLDLTYSIIETPLQSDGSTTFQQQCCEAEQAYSEYLELIKLEPYLAYSPEFQVIKNNYEISKNNCLTESATENCDINKTLQICLTEKEEDNKISTFSCSNLTLVEREPFIYYVNSGGIKVSFDEFPSCCKSIEGAKYISYVNEYGRTTEYCSKLAPCVGTPESVDRNGYIVFRMSNNTLPKDIIQLSDACFQYIFTKVPLESFSKEFGVDPQTYIKTYIYKGTNILKVSFDELFKKVDCNLTTTVSSPECCAWYGYDYKILKSDIGEYISCIPKNKISEPEIALNTSFGIATPFKTSDTNLVSTFSLTDKYTTPIIDKDVSVNYSTLENPMADVYKYYSTDIFWDAFNESRIVKGVVSDSNSLAVLSYSLLSDPNLMKPENWEVFSIDKYGRISFTPKTFDNSFILDWYSDQSLNDLYTKVAKYYGYQVSVFTFDYANDTIKIYNGDNPYSLNPNSTFTAAVDPNVVSCNDINNVSVVFASEKWKGFKLPEFTDCSCTIDFSFDYMLKYQAENLIKCADNISCFPAIIYDNSINNVNCLNFVAFTTSEEQSKILENNFNDSKDLTEEYVIWQNASILEPNIECCTGIGGNVVSFNQWATTNQTWVNNIKQTFNTLSNNPSQSFLNSLDFNYSDILSLIKEYTKIKNYLLNSCGDVNLDISLCDIDYENYITTQNVCSLQIPLECGLWSLMYGSYEKLYFELRKTLENVLKCAEAVGVTQPDKIVDEETYLKYAEAVGVTDPTLDENFLKYAEAVGLTDTSVESYLKYAEAVGLTEPPIDLVSIEKGIVLLNDQKSVQIDSFISQQSNLLTQLDTINQNITLKESQNTAIQKALTNVDNNLDCSVYENKIKEIDNFDYKTYCTSIVYETSVNDGSKNSEYNRCVESKTIENNAQKLDYSVLFTLCVKKNELNQQLVVAKFENNFVLVTELEKQILEISEKINTVTTSENNFISYNESLQKSTLQTNDTINTINIISELLNVSSQSITDSSGNIVLTDSQKVTLNIIFTKNTAQISSLEIEKSEIESLLRNILENQNTVEKTTNIQQDTLLTLSREFAVEEISPRILIETPLSEENVLATNRCCSGEIAKQFEVYIQSVEEILLKIDENSKMCYTNWYESLVDNYQKYEESNNANYLDYINDLKINFKLFVDNNNINVVNGVDTSLTYLPYTQSVNPIWEFDPTSGYTGIILEGSEQLIAQIEDSIFNQLSTQNITYDSNIFEPEWKTFKFRIPECVCDDLRRLYPNKEFFFAIEIENYECSVCLLVDNILVNVSDCKTQRILSINDCMIPQLSCVIDNKKSWVYYDGGVVKETVYPNGECNTESKTNFEIVKLSTPEERVWTDLEYRYTNYDNYHSDLILNVKNTSFSIDPAKSIECDVFNYWKNIDCQSCPTDCNENNFITFSGTLNSKNYDIVLNDTVTTGLLFSCATYTNLLQNQILELRNKYYILTSNYSESLNVGYYDLLEKGGDLSNFYIQKNSCGGDTIVLNNSGNLDNKFGLLIEKPDGTIGFYETYVYSGTSLYVGGVEEEILSGITAQTFNQTNSLTEECCKSVNKLLSKKGVDGLGLEKNYVWNSTNSTCNWRTFDECSNCKGDCEYCGKTKKCAPTTSSCDCIVVSASTEAINDQILYFNQSTIIDGKVSYIGLEPYNDREWLIKYNSGDTRWESYLSDDGPMSILNSTSDIPQGNWTLITDSSLLFSSYCSECPTTPNCDCIVFSFNKQGFSRPYILYLNQPTIIDGKFSYIGEDPTDVTKEWLIKYNSGDTRWEVYYNENLNAIIPSESLFDYFTDVDTSEASINYISCGVCSNETPTSNETYNVCINPLDFLDFDPSTIKVKDVFDQLVLSNLIDAKSRQTISDYPLLRLFYELYLNASNCGSDLSGKFTYDTMFEFMDKIGDYWLDLLEQVVPATTIWEGCDNSGKIYRNTIFDQNKFKYKKYSLNFIDVDQCSLESQTDFSIGQQSIDSLVEQIPIYPTNQKIISVKNEIRLQEIELAIAKRQLKALNGQLCSLNLQDLSTPNLNESIDSVNLEISNINNLIETITTTLNNLFFELSQLEKEYLEQQKNYINNFMSCTGITQTLINAENKLCSYIPGTIPYERQRNFIAGLRDKYEKCVDKANVLVSDYSTVFITQIYDSNEYEGNVTIIGDPDWEEGGPFYNQELIHNCILVG
jgi:hypothetical protein